MTNPIIEEVRAARAAIAAEHGYNRARILAWARAEQAALKMKNLNQARMAPMPPPISASVVDAPTSCNLDVRLKEE